MFRRKSRTEQLTEQFQDQSESLASTAGAIADQLRERVVPAVGQATENAREWARPHVEHGIEVAAPRLESAVSGLAPKVDTARDKIVDELIPRVAEAISVWAAASAAARDEAVSRGQGAAAVISGDAVATPRGGRKKKVLLGLGLIGAAGAAAMTVMKKSAPKDDPWTTPLADSYPNASNGRHSAGSLVDEATSKATTETKAGTSEIVDFLDEKGAPSPLDPTGDGELNTTDVPDEPGSGKDDTDKSSANKNGADKSKTDKDPNA